jgi:hypothetical protein
MTNKGHLDAVKPMAGFRPKSIGFATLVLALGMLTTLVPQAKAQFSDGPLTLQQTYLQGQPNLITATCSVASCIAPPRAIFRPKRLSVVCPKPADHHCDLYIHLESQDTRLTVNDTGLFRFWVDGTPATPGPVDANGFFTWDNNDPASRIAAPFSHSYAVVADVYNEEPNQAHRVEVDVSCVDANASGGCTATTGFSTLEVNVF